MEYPKFIRRHDRVATSSLRITTKINKQKGEEKKTETEISGFLNAKPTANETLQAQDAAMKIAWQSRMKRSIIPPGI